MAEGHDKVDVIIHTDYKQYPAEVLEKLKGAEGVVWAQGISQTAVSKEMYEEITFDYPLAAAKAFAPLSDPFKFVYVSGEGATTEPSRFTMLFGVVKGRAESSLLSLSQTPPYTTLKPFSVRPNAIDPSGHPAILPFIPNQSAIRTQFLTPLIKRLVPGAHSPTPQLAKVLVDLAMGDGQELKGEGISGNGRTLSNKAMKRLAGL